MYTAPVGLTGEQRMSPAARASAARSSWSTPTLRLHSTSPGTSTGVARAKCTSWGYETQAGAGINTVSPPSNRVKQALNSDCRAPEDTMM